MVGVGHPLEASPPSLRSLQSAIIRTNEVWRLRSKRLLESDAVALLFVTAVLFSVVLVVIETDHTAAGEEAPLWVRLANFCLLILFLLELAGRAFVERIRFFSNSMNLLDVIIVAVDVARLVVDSQFSAALLAMRSVRLLRIGRAFRVMVYIPELANMVRGMVGAFKALFWGSFLLTVLLAIWGILATQLIHPLNQELTRDGVWDAAGCERCPRAFGTVKDSMFTFTQQILAGDSWGLVTLPIMERYPVTVLFFVPVLCSIQLAMVNLILAAVLDKAAESRQQSEKELLTCKTAEGQRAKSKFVRLCKDLDGDGDGELTFVEVAKGFDEQLDFKATLEAMDIKREDLDLVFRVMDTDNSGSVCYEEFADELFKLRSNNVHTMIVFIRYYVADIWEKLHPEGREGRRSGLTAALPDTANANGGIECSGPEQNEQKSWERQEEKSWAAPAPAPAPAPAVAVVPASAWADKVNEGRPPTERKLSQRPEPGDELEKSRQECSPSHEDIQQALLTISEKLVAQTKMLEALPTLVSRDPVVTAPREIGCSVELPEGAPMRMRSSERRRKGHDAPTTPFCCQPSRSDSQVIRR